MATSTIWNSPQAIPSLTCNGPLAKLPFEIHQTILTHLKPPTVYSLRQTCRFFYHSIPIKDLPSKAVFCWLKAIEQDPTNTNTFACYSCFQLKPADRFMSDLIHISPLKKGAPRAHHRKCIDCCIKREIIQHGDVIHEGAYPIPGSTLLVYCYSCSSFRRKFCWNCKLCWSCVRVVKCRKKVRDGFSEVVVRIPHDFNSVEREGDEFTKRALNELGGGWMQRTKSPDEYYSTVLGKFRRH